MSAKRGREMAKTSKDTEKTSPEGQEMCAKGEIQRTEYRKTKAKCHPRVGAKSESQTATTLEG